MFVAYLKRLDESTLTIVNICTAVCIESNILNLLLN